MAEKNEAMPVYLASHYTPCIFPLSSSQVEGKLLKCPFSLLPISPQSEKITELLLYHDDGRAFSLLKSIFRKNSNKVITDISLKKESHFNGFQLLQNWRKRKRHSRDVSLKKDLFYCIKENVKKTTTNYYYCWPNESWRHKILL